MPTELPAPAPRLRRPFELSGRMVLAAFIGFFLVVIGVNALMMTAAIRTMSGVDVKSAYEVSQHFNSEIARMQEQAARGWQAQAHVGREGPDAAITLSLLDHDGKPVSGLSVAARLERPATRQQDHEAVLGETAPGRYAATVAGIQPGGWTLAVEARQDGEPVFVSRSRILLRD